MNKLRAIFAGGGTGGHLFPALAIANHLKKRIEADMDADFIFIGTKKGLEYRIKDKLGYRLELINIIGLRRSLTPLNLLFPILLVGSILKSMLIVSRFKPDIVIGTGGYVMAPVILAAVLLGKRRVIQEQNSYPGLATRKLASMVDRLFLGFGDAAKYLHKGSLTIETGNPVKDVIGKVSREEGLKHFGLDENKKTILILGGSQGASKINNNIMQNLMRLPDNFQLIWQTGERDYKEVAAVAGGKVTSRALFPFIDNVELAYAAADMVIARSGAITLAEIGTAGLPAVLIPYPYATGNHQMINAGSYAEGGVAVIIENEKLDDIDLLAESVKLMETGQAGKMADALSARNKNRQKPAVDMIVDEILKLIKSKEE